MGFHTESDCVEAFYYAFYVKKGEYSRVFFHRKIFIDMLNY